MTADRRVVITVEGLRALLCELAGRGYRAIGPTVRDGAILYDDIDGVDDLPKGWTDEQEAGRYRVARTGDERYFGFAVGPDAWKKYLHPPIQNLWRAERSGDTVSITAEPPTQERFAFIGVRACELRAIAIQDRVLMGGAHADPHYRARREGAFIVAVNCAQAGGTCFCVSMDAGPGATSGFDLALTELGGDDGPSLFVVETGSQAGRDVLAALPRRDATAEEVAGAEAVVSRTAASMKREMRTDGMRDLLMDNLQHPRWDDVAERCLSCGNCTMVCPTCFCTSVEDSSDLTGDRSSRTRRWDSCFTMDFSYLHGGSVRSSARSRYRQWMTHKLATWTDQFGTSGCVGCGRCITWCPVGIDITQEVRAIQESQPQGEQHHGD